ncbi:hypothetical protein LRAMOSA07666 [Lichtheimia ramosa]|uniref:RFX1-4/6/8-like BCD domain-containing protein n=1 Tax=Lichtheimia ramosa TaxID=688394 RepID=A0A077WEU4_9FUNG|nr:hypothetical protein LRAMOSA07666 [Lichtheimia ramosa]
MLPDRFRNAIRSTPEFTEAVWRWDCCLYDAIISTMLPKVYTPTPFDTLDSLRTYTRELLPCIEESLRNHYPETFVLKKLTVAEVFVSKFRRHLKLNFMANDVADMIHDVPTVDNMQRDWDTIDFDNVIDQSDWLCECEPRQIKHILQFDVHNLLSANADLDCWITWIKGIVDRFMGVPTQQYPYTVKHPSYYTFYAKEFIFKWTYCTTLLTKDLSSRHASSEESFRMMQWFFDDLVLYFVEQKLSKMALYSFQDATTASPLPQALPFSSPFPTSIPQVSSVHGSPSILPPAGSNDSFGTIPKLAEPPTTSATESSPVKGENA